MMQRWCTAFSRRTIGLQMSQNHTEYLEPLVKGSMPQQ
jgi:hypothetical protein